MSEPALTAEEWAFWLSEGSYELDGMLFRRDGDCVFPSHHGLAAAYLHNQPFGFTREDVAAVRKAGESWRWNRLKSLADRIEALLPPEDK